MVTTIQHDGTVRRVVRPYPLALAPLIEQRLRAAASIGSAAYESAVRHAQQMMNQPAFTYRPLPQAVRFHKSTAAYRWIVGGNRSSKSHALAQEVYWLATGTHPYREQQLRQPCVGWYAAPTWDLVGQILMVKLERLLSHLRPGRDYQILWHNKSKRIPDTLAIKVVDSRNGAEAWSKIVFKAYEQGGPSFYGTERDFIACDEQFPHDIYYEMITRIGAEVDMLFMAAFTPLIPQAWLQERLSGAETPSGWAVFNFPLDDNRISRGGFIKDEAIDALIDEWPEEMQETRRAGRWGSFVGLVYKCWNPDVHVVQPDRERTEKFLDWRPAVKRCMVPPQWPTTCGVDFGAVNPFVHLWACQIPHMENAWYIYDEYFWHGATQGTRLIREHAAEILARDVLWGSTVRQRFADHDVQDRTELAAAGVATLPARKDVRSGLETVQKWLKVHAHTGRPRLFIAARCKNVIREFAMYRWPDSTGPRDPKDVPIAKDDHTLDAIRYLLHSTEHALPASYVSTGGAYKRAVR